jgi:hypothetical protein
MTGQSSFSKKKKKKKKKKCCAFEFMAKNALIPDNGFA